MDIAIQLKKRNLEMIDHRQHVLGGTYILCRKRNKTQQLFI